MLSIFVLLPAVHLAGWAAQLADAASCWSGWDAGGRRARALRKEMAHAESYAEWLALGERVDEAEGRLAWKEGTAASSPDSPSSSAAAAGAKGADGAASEGAAAADDDRSLVFSEALLVSTRRGRCRRSCA